MRKASEESPARVAREYRRHPGASADNLVLGVAPAGMTATPTRAALINGASTGIVEATVKRVAADGWPVLAGVRRLEEC